jgi:glycosyltransferase involved in cell wall biosynthesis
MISFVVPAHNEQPCLPATLAAIHDSARALALTYEIIVVDDASTDATAEIARGNNARVVSVNHRQIAATRNSGARAAQGDRIFFVDADTTINPRTVHEALTAMNRGAVGGGGAVWIDWREPLPLYGRIIAVLMVIFPKLIGFTGGAFMFCTRAAYQATGGFDERLYWSEEGAFTLALRREGRFNVPWGDAEMVVARSSACGRSAGRHQSRPVGTDPKRQRHESLTDIP